MSDNQPRRRAPRSDKGKPRGPRPGGKVCITLSLRPDLLAHARKLVASGAYRSISDYVDQLISRDEIAGRIIS